MPIEISSGKRQRVQNYDPRDFGECSSSATDCTPSIQAALDAAKNAGGGVVLLPPGQRLAVTSLSIGTGVTLSGGTRYTRLWQKGSFEGDILTLDGTNVTDVVVERIMFQGGKANQTTPNRAIFFSNTAGSSTLMARHVIRDVQVEQCKGDGIVLEGYMRGSRVESTQVRWCDGIGIRWGLHDCMASDLDISQCKGEGLLVGGGATLFSNVKVWYCGRDSATPAEAPPGVRVQGNSVVFMGLHTQENYGEGVYVFKSGSAITGLVIRGGVLDADNLAGGGKGAFRAFNLEQSTIDIVVKKYSGTPSPGPAYGVSITGSDTGKNVVRLSSAEPNPLANVGALDVATLNGGQLGMVAIPQSASSAPNGSIFLDSSDNVLKVKGSAGTVTAIGPA